MGKEQDTYRAAFIYMGTCLPRTAVSRRSTKWGPAAPEGPRGAQAGAPAAPRLGSPGTVPARAVPGGCRRSWVRSSAACEGAEWPGREKSISGVKKGVAVQMSRYSKGCGQKGELKSLFSGRQQHPISWLWGLKYALRHIQENLDTSSHASTRFWLQFEFFVTRLLMSGFSVP